MLVFPAAMVERLFLDKEEGHRLWPADKTDDMCQSWQQSQTAYVTQHDLGTLLPTRGYSYRPCLADVPPATTTLDTTMSNQIHNHALLSVRNST